MLYVDEFSTNDMNSIERKVFNYFKDLDIESIVDNIDTTNATEIE